MLEWTTSLPGQVWSIKEPTIAFAPGGDLLAVSTRSPNHVVLVDPSNGQVVRRLEGHTSSVNAVTWSNGGQLASSSNDHSIRIWDIHSGDTRHVVRHDGVPDTLAWHPDGQRLILGSAGSFRVMTPGTGTTTQTGGSDNREIRNLSVSPDGRWFAQLSRDGTVWIHALPDGAQVARFEHSGAKYALGWSADSRQVVTGAHGDVRFSDRSSGSLLKTIEVQNSEMNSLAIDPENELLAIATDGVFAIYDRDDTEWWLLRIRGATLPSAVAWSPDGTRLVTADDEGQVQCWQIRKSNPKVELDATARWAHRQAASVGRRAPTTAVPWVPDLPSRAGECLGRFDGSGTGFLDWVAVAVSSDSRTLAVSRDSETDDRRITILDLHGGRPLHHLPCEGDVRMMDLSPDGRLLAVACAIPRVLDPTREQPVWQAPEATEFPTCAKWAPDGRRLALSTGPRLQIWDTRTNEPLQQHQAETNLQWLDWHPEGRRVASVSTNGTVDIWATGQDMPMATLEGSGPTAYHIEWSPNGTRLAWCGDEHRVRVWDPAREQMLLDLEFPVSMNRATWSPDGRILACAGDDDLVRLLDAESGEPITRFDARGPSDDSTLVWSLVWSPNGAFVVAGYSHDRVALWDTRAVLPAVTVPSSTGPLPAALRPLPRALAASHRMNLHPPLSLLADWVSLTAGQRPRFHPDLDPLRDEIRPIIDLQWPPEARLALLPVVLEPARAFAAESFEVPPPDEASPSQVRSALLTALSGTTGPTRPPPVPLAPLKQAAEYALHGERGAVVSELLTALGPEPFVADPTLWTQLRQELPSVPRLGEVHRRLLSGLTRGTRSGTAQATGPGTGRTGLSWHGPVSTLLHSQLALPDELFTYRFASSTLVYRARAATEPPTLRPLVVALDVSPATWGPIERLLRPAALALVDAVQQAGFSVRLLLLGGRPTSAPREDLRRAILTERRSRRVDLAPSLRLAGSLVTQLAGGWIEPRVLLLTHADLGRQGVRTLPRIPGLAGLFAGPTQGRPALADRCDHFRSVGTDEARLSDALVSLLG